MEKTQLGSPENGFDAARRAAQRRGIDSRVVESNRTLITEFEDATFLEPFCGTHRVQRIPKGETRRHTSTITVVALASEASYAVVLDEAELAERFTRGTGPGGQHKNKTDSCVILTHVPSGIEVRVDSRSQWQNRQEARAELAKRLADENARASAEAINGLRTGQIASADRAAKSFTYNTQRDEVLDHDTGQKWRLSAFMKGRF